MLATGSPGVLKKREPSVLWSRNAVVLGLIGWRRGVPEETVTDLQIPGNKVGFLLL